MINDITMTPGNTVRKHISRLPIVGLLVSTSFIVVGCTAPNMNKADSIARTFTNCTLNGALEQTDVQYRRIITSCGNFAQVPKNRDFLGNGSYSSDEDAVWVSLKEGHSYTITSPDKSTAYDGYSRLGTITETSK